MSEQKTRGFHQFLLFLLGEHKYQKNFNDPQERKLNINPFHPTRPLFFVGEYGITASMGDLMGILMRMITEEVRWNVSALNTVVKAFLIWKVPREAGNDILMGYRLQYNVYDGEEDHIAFGFTDYSGEGGRGYKDLRAIFEFLSDMYDIPVIETHVHPEHFEVVEELFLNANEINENNLDD